MNNMDNTSTGRQQQYTFYLYLWDTPRNHPNQCCFHSTSLYLHLA